MSTGLVFVLPGILGSQLTQQNKLFPNRVIWLNKVEVGIYGLDNLDLAPDGTSPGPLAGNPCLPDGLIEDNPYLPLLTQLLSDGWDLTVWAYDWRKSLASNAALFAAKLLSLPTTQPFYVAAHSMGGLVARLAFPIYDQAVGFTNWKRTVYLGTPHGGAYAPAAALTGWYQPGGIMTAVGFALGVGVRRILSPTGTISSRVERGHAVTAHWPGLASLLASTSAPFDGIDPLAFQLFNAQNYVKWNANVTAAYLAAAKAETVALSNSLNVLRAPEVCVAGYGQTTPVALADEDELPNDASYIYSQAGDRAVALNRAVLPGVQTLQICGDHYEIMNGSIIRSMISDLLIDGLPAPEVTPTPPPPTTTYLIPKKDYVPPLLTIVSPWKQTALDP